MGRHSAAPVAIPAKGPGQALRQTPGQATGQPAGQARSRRGMPPLGLRVLAFLAPAALIVSPLAIPAYAAPSPPAVGPTASGPTQTYTVDSRATLASARDGYTVTVPKPVAPKADATDVSAVSDADAGTTTVYAPLPPAPSPGSAQAIAAAMVKARGWGDDQYACLVSLWNKESGWNVYAANPSGAYGIPQAYPGSKMASAGADWQTSATTQITWGLGYISGRYGTPCAAWANSVAYNSY